MTTEDSTRGLEVPKMAELAVLYQRAMKAGNKDAAACTHLAVAAAAEAAGKAEEARQLAVFADLA